MLTTIALFIILSNPVPTQDTTISTNEQLSSRSVHSIAQLKSTPDSLVVKLTNDGIYTFYFGDSLSPRVLKIQPPSESHRYDTLFAILIGLATFIITQYLNKFVIVPVHELRKTIGDIRYALDFHANIYTNLNIANAEEIKVTSSAIRDLAFRLSANAYAVVLPRLFSMVSLLPNYGNIFVAASELTGLSNARRGTTNEEIDRRVRLIRKSLEL